MRKITKTLFFFSAMIVSMLIMGNTSSAKVIEVDSTAFPDKNVRQALYGFADGTGDLDTGFEVDTDKVTQLYIYPSTHGDSIESLKGLELLTKLSKLNINRFQGSKVNLDNNLLKTVEIYWPASARLVVEIPKAENLVVYDAGASLNALDVSKNKNLKSLQLFTKNIKSFDVSKNTNLSMLSLSGQKLKSVDVSKNKNLEQLSVNGSKNIKSVNTSKNTKLKELSLTYMGLKKIDISKNKKLTSLACYGTKITSLNLTKYKNLTSLNVSGTGLKTLNLTKNSNLGKLDVSGTKLKKLDLSKNNKLTSFNMSNTSFEVPDLKKKTKLVSLSLMNTKVKNLDLTKYRNLSSLYVSGTKLKKLDFSKNTELTWLDVSDTELTSLNLKNNKKLRWIHFDMSKISKLDLTGCNNLTIACSVKKGSKVKLKQYLGTGYEFLGRMDEDLEYDEAENSVKVNGETGKYYSFALQKGEKQYNISIHITK